MSKTKKNVEVVEAATLIVEQKPRLLLGRKSFALNSCKNQRSSQQLLVKFGQSVGVVQPNRKGLAVVTVSHMAELVISKLMHQTCRSNVVNLQNCDKIEGVFLVDHQWLLAHSREQCFLYSAAAVFNQPNETKNCLCVSRTDFINHYIIEIKPCLVNPQVFYVLSSNANGETQLHEMEVVCAPRDGHVLKLVENMIRASAELFTCQALSDSEETLLIGLANGTVELWDKQNQKTVKFSRTDHDLQNKNVISIECLGWRMFLVGFHCDGDESVTYRALKLDLWADGYRAKWSDVDLQLPPTAAGVCARTLNMTHGFCSLVYSPGSKRLSIISADITNGSVSLEFSRNFTIDGYPIQFVISSKADSLPCNLFVYTTANLFYLLQFSNPSATSEELKGGNLKFNELQKQVKGKADKSELQKVQDQLNELATFVHSPARSPVLAGGREEDLSSDVEDVEVVGQSVAAKSISRKVTLGATSQCHTHACAVKAEIESDEGSDRTGSQRCNGAATPIGIKNEIPE